MKALLVRAILNLTVLTIVYYVLGTVSLTITLGSYVYLEHLKTGKEILEILSVFETENEWGFIVSFVQNIIFKLPFADTVDLAGTKNILSGCGMFVEYLFRTITGKGFNTEVEKIQMWAGLFPSIVTASLSAFVFNILGLLARILDKLESDIIFKILKSVYLFSLSVFIAIASFSLSIAIMEYISIKFKDDINMRYWIYGGVLLFCIIINAKISKDIFLGLLIDIMFSAFGSILLMFLCKNLLSFDMIHTATTFFICGFYYFLTIKAKEWLLKIAKNDRFWLFGKIKTLFKRS